MDTGDRISELYKGEIFTAETQTAARERIHWICDRVEGRKVVDIGCSQGIVAILLARKGFSVVGIDTDSRAIEYAQADRAEETAEVQQRLTFVPGDLYGPDLPDHGFDTAIMGEFLEHQVVPERAIRRAYELLDDEGRFIVTVPFGLDRSPDHKQTFYVASLYRMIHPCFMISDVQAIGRYLCLLCVRRESVLEGQPDSIDLAFVETAEQQFEQREIALRDDRDARAKDTAKLKSDLSTARAELTTARTALNRASKDSNRLQSELERQRRALDQLRGSVSLQVGSILVQAALKPGRNTVLLPYRLVRLVVVTARRRMGRLSKARGSSRPPVGSRRLPLIPPRKAVPPIGRKARTAVMLLYWSLPYACNGYAIRSHGLLSNLAKTSWDVSAYTRPGYPGDSKSHAARPKGESTQVDEVTYHHLKGTSVPDPYSDHDSHLEESARMVGSVLRATRPAVVHSASNHLLALPALVAARRLGLPFLYEVRGLWEMTESSVDPALEGSHLLNFKRDLETLVSREADAVITLTSGLADELVRRGVRRDNIRVVPNCVDVGRFKPLPPDKDLRARVGLSDAPTIGYIGSFVAYEGLDDLVRSAAMLKERGVRFNLLLVGDGRVLNEIRELTRRLDLDKVVFLTGRVPHDEAEAYYSLIDIAPFPRKPVPVCEMVSPLKPLEAMAMGKVVVASSVDALKDIVVDRETGLLFEKGDVQALADKLAEAITNPDLAARVSSQGRDWVRANRTWDMAAKEMVAVYEDLSSRHEASLAASTQRHGRGVADRQKDTRIAVYADANMNLIDGSSIWTVSLVEALAGLEHTEVFLFLKSGEKRNLLTEPLRQLTNVSLVGPADEDELVRENLTPEAALDRIEDMDRMRSFDVMVLRGFSLCQQATARAPLQGRLWSYLTDIPQNQEDLTGSALEALDVIAGASKYILCQTEEFLSYWERHVPSAQAKLRLLPPMIPRFNVQRHAPAAVKRICYAGKFAPMWGILEMFEAFQRLRAANPQIELHVFGDKIHDPPESPDFRRTILSRLESTPGVVWYRGLGREEVLNHMSSMDLGWAWRNPQLENNTLELSTKILEYGACGLPVILYRNAVNERLLEADYPLFANSLEEVLDLMHGVIGSPDTLSLAAERAHAAAERFTMDNVREQYLRPLLDYPPHETCERPPERGSILIAGHDLKFIDGLARRFSEYGYAVDIDTWDGHDEHDEERSAELLEEADIVICEWCLGNAVWYSENKREGQKLIIRFHLQERDTPFPERLDLGKVDTVIFVGPHLRREAIARFGWERWADDKLVVIPNYVDTGALDLSKPGDAQYRIGIVGIVPQRKRFDLALDVIEKLRSEDERFHLYVKGKMPEEYRWMSDRPDELRYYRGQMDRIRKSKLLKGAVHYDGWGDDMPEWYREVGFVLSVSDFESFHLSVPEGAAAGAVPMLLKWEGAEEIYPEDWSHHTADEIATAILDIARSGRFKEIAESRCAYVKQNFDIERVARLWLNMIQGDT